MKIKHVNGKNICTHSFSNLKIKNNYIHKAFSFFFFLFNVASMEVVHHFLLWGILAILQKNIDPTTSKYFFEK
jgi:hypothetical protein